MIYHNYKVWPEYYDALLSGAKTFEVRRMDNVDHCDVRMAAGDKVSFIEYDPQSKTTGRQMWMTISYVLRGDGVRLPPGWIVFAVKNPVESRPLAEIMADDEAHTLDISKGHK